MSKTLVAKLYIQELETGLRPYSEEAKENFSKLFRRIKKIMKTYNCNQFIKTNNYYKNTSLITYYNYT